MKEKKRIGHDDRINIQAAIAKGWTLAQTAKLLSKSRSTVYREILGNLTYKDCRHSCSHCEKGCPRSERPPYRNGRCPLFEARGCERWKSWPYCCNGCPESQYCADRKRYYDCVDANALSVGKRHEPRVHKGISDEAIAKMDSIVSEGVLKGQSLHHIFESDASLKAICCERNVRRHAGRVVAIAQSSNNAGGNRRLLRIKVIRIRTQRWESFTQDSDTLITFIHYQNNQ